MIRIAVVILYAVAPEYMGVHTSATTVRPPHHTGRMVIIHSASLSEQFLDARTAQTETAYYLADKHCKPHQRYRENVFFI